jgi:cytochrome c oxidase subunit 2
VPVYEGHVGVDAGERLHRGQPAESAADDDDPVTLGGDDGTLPGFQVSAQTWRFAAVTHRGSPATALSRRAQVLLLVACLVLAGCGRQSIVSPRSPQTHSIQVLWWWMLGVGGVVFLGAVGMLVLGWIRRHEPGLPHFGTRELVPQTLVVVFGIAIPVVVLVALFGVADIYLVKQTAPPAQNSTAMTIDVIGHQWWWEVRYPSTDAVTANEIHIPVNTRVNVVATTADVIHSFWVPQLARKIDEVPGRQNRILLEADRVGKYRGQCAEFCGLQHANMALYVIAQPMPAFKAWLSDMSAPARKPAGAAAVLGEHLFMADQCASCHTISGTAASYATVGPNLTHLATRTSLAAATIPNTPSDLEQWIVNPQSIKPGARMPDLGLSRAAARQIVAYLDSLS